MSRLTIVAICALLLFEGTPASCQTLPGKPEFVHIGFNSTFEADEASLTFRQRGEPRFVEGTVDDAVRFDGSSESPLSILYEVDHLELNRAHDFSLEFRVRSTMDSDQRAVLLSTREFPDNSLSSQKEKGWTFSIFNGTLGWSIGSGGRRISYDRTNGEYLPLNDGRWHHLTMTHSADGLIRLYYDGRNIAIYNVRDGSGFDFGKDLPLTIGWNGDEFTGPETELPVFVDGAGLLQELVDEFNSLGLSPVQDTEFELLVSDPDRLYATKANEARERDDEIELPTAEEALQTVDSIRLRMMQSRYTVHQRGHYGEVALVFQLYRLVDGQIVIDPSAAARLAKQEVLTKPSFDLDDVTIWTRTLSDDEVRNSYLSNLETMAPGPLPEELAQITAGCWNIFHGGIHQSIERDGWDSRDIIIELIRREGIDVLMMQETYSHGDYIAAELGYYFATTVDWDNMHQGSNISVLSRYPIKEVHVPHDATFMNVAARVSVSETQDLFVMSNWFGMSSFNKVFEFHQERFRQTDSVPVLFGGDFNAVPDVDGGDNEAYRRLIDAGFTDAFREAYPDPEQSPGFTHRSDNRIDQIYYKGAGLRNVETRVFSEWPTVFPSDHYLIKTVFELDFETDSQR